MKVSSEIKFPICIKLPKVHSESTIPFLYIRLYNMLDFLGYKRFDNYQFEDYPKLLSYLKVIHVHKSGFDPHLLIGFNDDYTLVAKDEGNLVDIWDSSGAITLSNSYFEELDAELLRRLFKYLNDDDALRVIIHNLRNEITNEENN